MNALVMAMVLVVGDVGDIGPKDAGAVCVNFGGEWEGVWVSERNFRHHILLRGGRLYLRVPKAPFLEVCPYSLEAESESRARLVLDRVMMLHCDYRVEGQRIRLCFTRGDEDTEWWILKRTEPAQPRK
jgi:hypothetical protein